MTRSNRFMFLSLIAALAVGAVALHQQNTRLENELRVTTGVAP